MTATTGTIAREVAKVIADVLGAEMALDQAHCLLGDQKWNIPADKALFVVVFDQGGPTVGASNFLDTDATSDTYGLEVQQSSVLHDIRIELMSYDSEARIRKEEPGLALSSIAAQQAEGLYLVQIGRAQTPVDASETEVSGRLLKFVTHVNVTALHQKVKTPPGSGYFDKFNGATADGSANPPEVDPQ